MSFIDRVFRRRARDLRGVQSPVRVELECEVASPDVVISPVSSTRGALIRWTLLEQRTFSGGRGGGTETSYRVLSRGLYGALTVLLAHDGQSIEVPLGRATLVLVEDPEDGEILQSLPPSLATAVGELRASGPIAYREAHLRHGDRVRLTSTLERLRTDTAPGYRHRADGGPMFRALAGERVVVRDVLV